MTGLMDLASDFPVQTLLSVGWVFFIFYVFVWMDKELD